MSLVLNQLPQRSRVAIIRLRSLGDAVLTTPAIHLLKRARPDLHVGVVIEPRFAGVFESNPDVDAIIEPTLWGLRRFDPTAVFESARRPGQCASDCAFGSGLPRRLCALFQSVGLQHSHSACGRSA